MFEKKKKKFQREKIRRAFFFSSHFFPNAEMRSKVISRFEKKNK